MSLAAVLEYIFRNQHSQSEFAHACLFVMLLFLFYTFLLGVREQIEDKKSYLSRKKIMKKGQSMAQPTTSKQSAPATTAGEEKK